MKNLHKLNFVRILFKRESIFQLIGQFGSQLLGFMLGVVIVRFSGLEVTGSYYSLLALMQICAGVVGSGIKTNFYRTGEKEKYPTSSYSIGLSMSFLSLLFVPIAVFVLDYNLAEYLLVSAIIVFMSLSQNSVAFLRINNRDAHAIPVMLAPPLIGLLGIFIFKPDITLHLVLILFLSWLVVIVFVIRDFAQLKTSIKISYKGIFNYLRNSITLIGTTLLTAIYGSLDIILLKNLISSEEAGLYKIAISMTMVILPTISIFSFVYLSKIIEKIKAKDINSFLKLRNEQLKLSIFLCGCFLILSLFLNRWLIYIIYGIISETAYYASVILAASVFFNVLAMVNSYSLLAFKREKELFKTLLIVTILNIILNVILIQLFSLIGAAITSLITQMSIFYLLGLKLRSNIKSFRNSIG